MAQLKRGRLNKAEEEFILKNTGTMTIEAIAQQLNRSPETVTSFATLHVDPESLSKLGEIQVEDHIAIRQELRNSESWKRLKDEFTQQELKLFEEEFVKLMGQFKGDVLATEETQIAQAIKYDILMSRNLRARQRAITDIGRLEKMQRAHLEQFGEDPSRMDDAQKQFTLGLETQIQAAKAAEQARTTEYVKLQERHESLMKTLKATRDQRIKQIESSKISFLGIVKMLQDKERQHVEGRQLELMKLAEQKSFIDLGRPHKFDDNNEDSPILCCDTVELGPEGTDEPEAGPKKIFRNLFIGSQKDYEDFDRSAWYVVQACKEPYHREALGYKGSSAANHPEYLFARRDNRLILNLVDADDPSFILKEIIDAALSFIHEGLQQNKKVLVHCNRGESRGPSIGLLYLLWKTDKLPLVDFSAAEEAFRKLYPKYNPSGGMRGFIESHFTLYASR